ncbi:MAG: ABC transporter substrate-binding protein [Candidatus Thorarchaeota archaeon]|nr:MAG: ABC transporter substrate-binding protein [Candidatus Thorarchaeota archaeon]
MNRNQIIAIVVIVVVIGGAGVFFFLQPTPPTGQTLVYETYGNPDYMDPHNNYETFGSMIHYNVYETLYTYEWDTLRTDPVVPLLAENLVISSDGKTYTFTLRQGVTFHDGTPFNASAVQYNFERMLGTFDPGGPVWMVAEPILGGQAIENAVFDENLTLHTSLWNQWVADNAAGTGAVNVISEFVVEVNLAYAYSPFLAAITYEVGAMISPTWVESLGGIEVGSHDPTIDIETMGTGPFTLTEWTVDERVVLTKYDNYWRNTASKTQFPYSGAIDEVVIKINDEENSRILNVKAGTADIVTVNPSSASLVYNNVTPSAFASNDGTAQSLETNLKIWAMYPSFSIADIHFTMSETLNETTLGRVVENPYRLKNFRKTLSHALDYQTVIDNVAQGFGTQGQGPVPIGMFGHNDSAYQYPYDLEMAKTFWNAAMNDDGLDAILSNNSYRLVFYYNTGNEVRRKTQLLLKDGLTAMLALPGVVAPGTALTIDVVGLEWSTYLGAARSEGVGCWMIGWAPDYADPDNYVGPYVKSTGTYAYWARLAESAGWDEAEVDGWITDAAQSTDDAERIALYEQVQDAIIEHAAYIWVYQSLTLTVTRSNVFNAQYNANPMHSYYFFHMYKGE